jgi:hypothetical protein
MVRDPKLNPELERTMIEEIRTGKAAEHSRDGDLPIRR